MKKLFVFITIITLTFISCQKKGYEYKDGVLYDYDYKFEIAFPGEPKHLQEPLNVGDFTVNYQQFSYEADNGYFYLISVIHLPKAAQNQDVDQLLNSVVYSNVGSQGLNITEKRNTTIENQKAIFFKAEGDYYIEGYAIYTSDGRVFQIMLAAAENYPDQATADKFFNSFRLR